MFPKIPCAFPKVLPIRIPGREGMIVTHLKAVDIQTPERAADFCAPLRSTGGGAIVYTHITETFVTASGLLESEDRLEVGLCCRVK